jgi:sugar lactone lactonase YvrE
MKMMAALSALVLAGLMTQAAAASCPCTNFFTGDTKPFIAEGIARDAVGDRFFVAGVAARRILAIRNGHARVFARMPDEYSPLGIAVAGGSLWVTAAVIPQGAGHEGPSALIAFDLGGKVKTVYPVPDEGRHVLNDLTFAPDGTVYTSDARDGSLYRLMPGASVLTRLGPRALLKSPQGMAVSRDGKFLLVADYSLGLVKIDLATAAFEPLKIPADVKTKGIDGLALLADGRFLASQNGLAEPRILRLTLSPDWSQLLSLNVVAEDDAAIADPSLVMADSSGAYVVGVSQWASFGQDRQAPTKPLQAWHIVKLDVTPRR